MSYSLDRLTTLTVSDVMSRKVVWVSTQQKMADVAALLLHHEISSAPVVDATGFCVGMISATDFLRRDSIARTEQSSPHRASGLWERSDIVESFMTTSVQSIDSKASLLQAANIVCLQHVHRLPVIDRSGRPVGVISTMDIVATITNVVAESEKRGL